MVLGSTERKITSRTNFNTCLELCGSCLATAAAKRAERRAIFANSHRKQKWRRKRRRRGTQKPLRRKVLNPCRVCVNNFFLEPVNTPIFQLMKRNLLLFISKYIQKPQFSAKISELNEKVLIFANKKSAKFKQIVAREIDRSYGMGRNFREIVIIFNN